jgi:hypothetical protein
MRLASKGHVDVVVTPDRSRSNRACAKASSSDARGSFRGRCRIADNPCVYCTSGANDWPLRAEFLTQLPQSTRPKPYLTR